MTEYEQKQIFSQNLQRLIRQSGKEQKQIAFDVDEKPTTFNQWVLGKALPSVSKVHTLADYFGVSFDDLVNTTISPEITPNGTIAIRKYKTDYVSGNTIIENIDSNTNAIKRLSQYLKGIELLNDDGLAKVRDYIGDLIKVPDYQKGEISENSEATA